VLLVAYFQGFSEFKLQTFFPLRAAYFRGALQAPISPYSENENPLLLAPKGRNNSVVLRTCKTKARVLGAPHFPLSLRE
jgi:hypothetical protein